VTPTHRSRGAINVVEVGVVAFLDERPAGIDPVDEVSINALPPPGEDLPVASEAGDRRRSGR